VTSNIIPRKYIDWIRQNVPDNCLGDCKTYSEAMQHEFKELRIVRGHYYCPVWGERGHWWLVHPEGYRVDPTAKQFPSRGGGVYIEWEEGQAEPTGLCLNCGGYVYNGHTCCSEECHREAVAALNDPGGCFL